MGKNWLLVLSSHPFSVLHGYGRPSLLVPPPSGLNVCKFFPFLLPTFSSLLVVFAVLCIAFTLYRKVFGVFWTQITWSCGNWRFYANCRFVLAVSVFLPLITLWVGRKLVDKSKDKIMTEVLRVFAGLEVKAIQVAYEVVRVTFATPEHFRASKSYSG